MSDALTVPLYFNSGVSVYSPNIGNVTAGQTTCSQANFTEAPALYSKSK
jgi:hypothetical protein